MLKYSTRIVVIVVLVCGVLVCVGCESKDADSTAEKLLRRQQNREAEAATSSRTPEERLREAERFFEQGNAIEAERLLRPLLISRSDDPAVLLLAARCMASLSDSGSAVALLDRIAPDDETAYLQAAILSSRWMLESQNYGAAEQYLTDAISRLEPGGQTDLSEAYRRLAALLNNQGRRIEAAKYLRLLARGGEITEKELFALHALRNAFIDVTLPKPDFRGELKPIALAEAMRLRAERELDQSLRLTERLSAAFPDSRLIAAHHCRLLAEMNRDAALRTRLATVPAEIGDQPSYWYSVGVLLQRNDDPRRAAGCLLEAVKLDATDPAAWLALARSLKELGNDAAAAEAKQRFELLSEAEQLVTAIGLRPGGHDELSRLAEILEELDRPWEAIAWREIDQQRHGGDRDALRRLRQRLDEREAASQDADADSVDVVGVDLKDWRRPDPLELAASLSSMPSPEPSRSGSPASAEIVLADVAAEVGLRFEYDNGNDPQSPVQYLHQLTGGGIAVIDYDLDGFPDLYLTQGGGDAFDPQGSRPNELYRNRDGSSWQRITAGGVGDRGYGQGACVCDVNQDGFPDILLANIGDNRLFRNNGDGTFTPEPLHQASVPPRWTTSIACGDLSGDGLPEVIEINYVDDAAALTTPCTPNSDVCNPSAFTPAADRVWQIGPRGERIAWDGCRDMASKPNYGFGAIVANFDGRHGNDVFIANDTEANHFWLSGDDGSASDFQLVESAPILGCAFGVLGQRNGCMGIASGDFDRNGTLDLHVTNFWNQAADLYLQGDTGTFSNGSAASGIYEPTRLTVGWGTQAVDFDRDGQLDLAVLNGNVVDHRRKGRPYRMLPQLFRGGGDGFAGEVPADAYWSTPALGRTMATFDWNRDGRTDLVVNHLDRPAGLLENRTAAGNSVQVELVGVASERDAIGAKLTATCGDASWTAWLVGGDGMLSSNEAVVDFGLGRQEQIDSLEIHWPSGLTQRFLDLEANRRYRVVEGQTEAEQSGMPGSARAEDR